MNFITTKLYKNIFLFALIPSIFHASQIYACKHNEKLQVCPKCPESYAPRDEILQDQDLLVVRTFEILFARWYIYAQYDFINEETYEEITDYSRKMRPKPNKKYPIFKEKLVLEHNGGGHFTLKHLYTSTVEDKMSDMMKRAENRKIYFNQQINTTETLSSNQENEEQSKRENIILKNLMKLQSFMGSNQMALMKRYPDKMINFILKNISNQISEYMQSSENQDQQKIDPNLIQKEIQAEWEEELKNSPLKGKTFLESFVGQAAIWQCTFEKYNYTNGDDHINFLRQKRAYDCPNEENKFSIWGGMDDIKNTDDPEDFKILKQNAAQTLANLTDFLNKAENNDLLNTQEMTRALRNLLAIEYFSPLFNAGFTMLAVSSKNKLKNPEIFKSFKVLHHNKPIAKITFSKNVEKPICITNDYYTFEKEIPQDKFTYAVFSKAILEQEKFSEKMIFANSLSDKNEVLQSNLQDRFGDHGLIKWSFLSNKKQTTMENAYDQILTLCKLPNHI